MIKIGVTERGDAGRDFSWFSKARMFDGIILITKHLSPDFISRAEKTNSIVHATITGQGGSAIEPGIQPWQEQAEQFRALISRVSPRRAVLRIDPIMNTPESINGALAVYRALHTELPPEKRTRVRISFLDLYPHARARFAKAGINPNQSTFHLPFSTRKQLASLFPDAEICGEPGFQCTGCVSELDLAVFGVSTQIFAKGRQRSDCACLAAKTEVLSHRGQCQHGCLYCYWK